LSTLAETSVTALKGAGPKVAERLKRLAIESIEDLLFHLPFRYEDRTRIVPIGALRPEQLVVIEGEVLAADVLFGRRRSLLVRIGDGTGLVSLRFYHFSAAQKNNLERGARVRVYGEVRAGGSGLEFYHPEYEVARGVLPPLEKSLTPVYHTTEGVQQRLLRNLMAQALLLLKQKAPRDLLPPSLLMDSDLPTLQSALIKLHTPLPDDPVDMLLAGEHPAVRRLVMEEMIAHQLAMLSKRAGQKANLAPRLIADGLRKKLLEALPFTLTGAQQRVIAEIDTDLAVSSPMLRLVQGDVGSGKTLVAACAALSAITSGYQVALMAPTEILAEQHLKNFLNWLAPLGIEVAWLAGSLGQKARRETYTDIAEGRAQIIVGTHALFQDAVEFHRLGLVVIDEQHRFGVHQRLALREKGRQGDQVPHQLVLTATPIPRTLAMSVYGDLDTSVIDELPPGRQAIETVVIGEARRPKIVERIRDACLAGTQAYWVCTLIDESEALQAQAAEDTLRDLQIALPELRVELVHGRMKSKEKAERMANFASGAAHVLVATTVIEVGVDVPNATLMVIENAERLGLSQLHQLRGRVGRGAEKSFCVLMYSGRLSETAQRRLHIMRDTCDGFRIAEEDLKLRGPGEWLGTRQTGDMAFRIADLMRDEAWLEPAREMALCILSDGYQFVAPLIQRWLRDGEDYADV
jgi:ATP-dependent DNA helicase RecG